MNIQEILQEEYRKASANVLDPASLIRMIEEIHPARLLANDLPELGREAHQEYPAVLGGIKLARYHRWMR